jgi:RNA polymerase sigma factor for flagellar operon FliA
MRGGYAQAGALRNPQRDKLITEHVDMARRIALKAARRLPERMTHDDIIAAAMVGLTEAADRYDSTRGEPFVAFAEKRIRGAVLDELRRGDLLPRRARTTANKMGHTIAQLEQKLGRSPEDEEIAGAMGVGVDKFREELAQLTHVAVVELDGKENGGKVADRAPSPATEAERAQLVQRLREALDRIPERDALVLSLYYNEDFNYVEIGEVLGVSESRVCQLHARALSRLRAELSDVNGEDD